MDPFHAILFGQTLTLQPGQVHLAVLASRGGEGLTYLSPFPARTIQFLDTRQAPRVIRIIPGEIIESIDASATPGISTERKAMRYNVPNITECNVGPGPEFRRPTKNSAHPRIITLSNHLWLM